MKGKQKQNKNKWIEKVLIFSAVFTSHVGEFIYPYVNIFESEIKLNESINLIS